MPSRLLFSVKIVKGGSRNKRGNEVFEFGYAELPSIFYKNKHNFKEKSFCVEKNKFLHGTPFFPLAKGLWNILNGLFCYLYMSKMAKMRCRYTFLSYLCG